MSLSLRACRRDPSLVNRMAFQSRLDFVAKSALFRPFHSAIVEDASVDRRAVTARRALERETRATEPARARDRERENDRERACDDSVEAIWALSSREGAAACARLWARDDAGGTTQS